MCNYVCHFFFVVAVLLLFVIITLLWADAEVACNEKKSQRMAFKSLVRSVVVRHDCLC